MTTPVLTKQQQRHSLSAKKKLPAKGLRNILAQPGLNFWPVVKVDQYPELVTNLNRTLPSIKQTSNKIPKHMLKNISKENRALARKELLKAAPAKPDVLKFMIMGINIVTRALEKGNVCCVLLDANVEPPLLIKHIVTMARNKKIPVLLLPILKTVTLEKIGFATAAFALKQEVKQCSNNVCHPLYKSIAEAFEDLESQECLLRFKSDETSDNTMREVKTIRVDCNTDPKISKPEKPVTVFTDVYKYRVSRDTRVFVPPTAKESSEVSQGLDDFIALDSDPEPIDNKYFKSTLKRKRYVNIGNEDKHTKESEDAERNLFLKKLKLINNNAESMKHTKGNTLKTHGNDEPTYLSLKLKRIQGNDKRAKATKLTKNSIMRNLMVK
ncbi:PREDICTED: uncharacterized protein LOC105565478 [Vollenhovia emeryi]|uniref:uncharacterized protein LOC105565478 n=1 Tax=Vollenhovia emeryi TaxID=411798 RepID=UPI0005F5779A|nr:PREDICTED: uncharacterized protein LOC105565478 [Vollenhovia emeryi]